MIFRAIIPLFLFAFFLSSCCVFKGRKSGAEVNNAIIQSNGDGFVRTKSDSVLLSDFSGQDAITSPNDDMNNQIEQKLIRGKWILIEIDGTPVIKHSSDDMPFIEFKSENQRIQGFAGCNNFFGKYQITDEREISFSEIGATKKYCVESMETEKALFNILSKSHYIEITENRLMLKSKAQNKTVIFRHSNQSLN